MRRNTTTVYVPNDLYFRFRVDAGGMRAERITFGATEHAPDTPLGSGWCGSPGRSCTSRH